MTVGKYLVAIIAVAAEAFGMYSLYVFFFYLWNDYKNAGMPGLNEAEAGVGAVWALSYALPFLAIAAILFWKIWPYLEGGKLVGRRLPMLIGVCVFLGMSAWWGISLLCRA